MKCNIELLLEKSFTLNPYWEKWGKGRPSRVMLEKREMYWKWQKENRTPVGLLSALLGGSSSKMNDKNEIKYINRQL